MRRLRSLRLLAAIAALAMPLGGCNGVHSTGTAVPRVSLPNPLGGGTGFWYASDVMREAHMVKPASFKGLGIDVVVKLQNPNGLFQYAAAVRTPSSAVYHHFLTPEEVADRFMASSNDYAAAMKYLKKFGLKVSGWKQRFMLHVSGTQRQLERAFSTKFAWYQRGGETFLGPVIPPSVPKTIPIVGSNNIVYRTKQYRPSMKKAQSNGIGSGYSPQQIQLGFDYAGAYNVNYMGSQVTIGIIGTGPVSLQNGPHLGDLEAIRGIYRAQGRNTVNLVPVTGSIGGLTWATPPSVTATTTQCNDVTGAGSDNPSLPPSQSPTAKCNPEDGEAQIDTEQTALLAPSANVNFYLGYTPDKDGYTAQGLAVWEDEVQQAINDNAADVLLLSFGEDEQFASQNGMTADEAMFANLAVQGVSVFASSGDNGAYACQDRPPNQYTNDFCVAYPASDPNVTAVGGVNVPMNSGGQFTGPLTAWGETTTGGLGGTGGGISAFISMPGYQLFNGQPMPGMQSGSCPQTPCRNLPDVSLVADPKTGVATVMNADPSIGPRQTVPFGGTSVAAAQMTGMWALAVGVCKVRGCGGGSRLGVANALLYPLYETPGEIENPAPTYLLTFYDVLSGTNGQCYNATCPPSATLLPGQNSGLYYDLATGLGVPFARSLIRGVTGA